MLVLREQNEVSELKFFFFYIFFFYFISTSISTSISKAFTAFIGIFGIQWNAIVCRGITFQIFWRSIRMGI